MDPETNFIVSLLLIPVSQLLDNIYDKEPNFDSLFHVYFVNILISLPVESEAIFL